MLPLTMQSALDSPVVPVVIIIASAEVYSATELRPQSRILGICAVISIASNKCQAKR